MNRENIEYAIWLLKKKATRKNFNMRNYQSEMGDLLRHQTGMTRAETIAELHAFNLTACFAGYIALSDKFRAEGGRFSVTPIFKNHYGKDAIACWLDISRETASKLIIDFDSEFYERNLSKVKRRHVIRKLKKLLKSGENESFKPSNVCY